MSEFLVKCPLRCAEKIFKNYTQELTSAEEVNDIVKSYCLERGFTKLIKTNSRPLTGEEGCIYLIEVPGHEQDGLSCYDMFLFSWDEDGYPKWFSLGSSIINIESLQQVLEEKISDVNTALESYVKSINLALDAVRASISRYEEVNQQILEPVDGVVTWTVDHCLGSLVPIFTMKSTSDNSEVIVDVVFSTPDSAIIRFNSTENVPRYSYRVSFVRVGEEQDSN